MSKYRHAHDLTFMPLGEYLVEIKSVQRLWFGFSVVGEIVGGVGDVIEIGALFRHYSFLSGRPIQDNIARSQWANFLEETLHLNTKTMCPEALDFVTHDAVSEDQPLKGLVVGMSVRNVRTRLGQEYKYVTWKRMED